MLTNSELLISQSLEKEKLLSHLEIIASFNRRSDGKGESEAREYVKSVLCAKNIFFQESFEDGLFGFSGPASLHIQWAGRDQHIPAVSWNFSANTDSKAIRGSPIYLNKTDFPLSPLDYLSSLDPAGMPKDLIGKVIFSTEYSPFCVLSAEDRGAIAYVVCWPCGNEDSIHHSGSYMGWGIPQPEETRWFPSIPVIAISGKEGNNLLRLFTDGVTPLFCSISTQTEILTQPVHLLEATIPSSDKKSPWFILIGAHLDSKYFGATDNATGAALALSLVEALALQKNTEVGVKICWWSGHEFGRYTGSTFYSRKNFLNLNKHCIAYTNIDMPGLKGATNFRRVTAGPDLFPLALETVRDITQQEGNFGKRVRGWDQSFQNIGISPYFIWSSTLPDDSPFITGRGFMPWWWHTEFDTLEFYDPEILFKDALIYLIGVTRLRNATFSYPDPELLWNDVIVRINSLAKICPESYLEGLLNFSKDLISILIIWKEGNPHNLKERIGVIRILNKIIYAARGEALQDWGDVPHFIPGLSEAFALLLSKKNMENTRKGVIVENYARTQMNRIILLIDLLREKVGE